MARRVRQWRAWGVALGVVAAGVAAACGGDNTCVSVLGPGQTLAGTYRVDSNAVNVINGVGVPGVTGGVLLTDTIYSVTLNIPGFGAVSDSGTYKISCNTIAETSVLGNPALVGTFAVSGDTLTVRGTVQGLQQLLILLKQP